MYPHHHRPKNRNSDHFKQICSGLTVIKLPAEVIRVFIQSEVEIKVSRYHDETICHKCVITKRKDNIWRKVGEKKSLWDFP